MSRQFQRSASVHTDLIHAIRSCNAEEVQRILASVPCSDDCYSLITRISSSGQYPLHYTLLDMRLSFSKSRINCRIKIIEAILQRVVFGEKMNYLKLQDNMGRTALHTAAIGREKKVVNFLLENLSLAERLELIAIQDNQHLTVLQQPISDEIRGLIISYMSKRKRRRDTNIKLQQKKSFNNPCSLKDQPSERSAVQTVSAPSSSTSCAKIKLTPKNAFSRFEDVVEIAKADQHFKVVFDLVNSEGKTLLHLAAQNNRLDIVTKVLSAVEDKTQHWGLISKISNSGKTALHYACAIDSVEITTTLLKYSRERDVELTELLDNKSYTASRYAKSWKITKLLSLVESHYWRVFYQRPKAVIFYNRFYSYQRWRRDGAEKEKNHMKQALEQYGIVPQVHVDFSENTFECKLAEFIEGEDDISALIVVIMSHGELGYIYDINLRLVRIQTLIDTMCYNSKLENVPKVLVLQCCQNAGDAASTGGSCRHNRADASPASPLLTRRASPDPETYQIPAGDNSTTIICSALGGQTSIRGRMAEAFSGTATQSSRPGDVVDIFRSISRQMGRRLPPVLHTTMSRTLALTNLLTQRSILERIRDVFSPS